MRKTILMVVMAAYKKISYLRMFFSHSSCKKFSKRQQSNEGSYQKSSVLQLHIFPLKPLFAPRQHTDTSGSVLFPHSKQFFYVSACYSRPLKGYFKVGRFIRSLFSFYSNGNHFQIFFSQPPPQLLILKKSWYFLLVYSNLSTINLP